MVRRWVFLVGIGWEVSCDLLLLSALYAGVLLCHIISLQLGGEAGIMNPEMKKMRNVMRLFAILMIPITSQLPAVRREEISPETLSPESGLVPSSHLP